MIGNQIDKKQAGGNASVARIDMKLEAVVISVSDVDRAKRFYLGLGWRLDADFPFSNGFRVVQFTPPGSGCSIQFGTKITWAEPGSARVSTWSSPISRRRATISPAMVPRSARCSTPGRRALRSSLTARADV